MVLLFTYSTVANSFCGPEEMRKVILLSTFMTMIKSCIGKKGFTFSLCRMSGIFNVNLVSTKSQIKELFPDSGNQKA